MVKIEKAANGYILMREEGLGGYSKHIFTSIEDLFDCLLSEFEGLSRYNSGDWYGRVTVERREKVGAPPPLPKPNPKAIEHF